MGQHWGFWMLSKVYSTSNQGRLLVEVAVTGTLQQNLIRTIHTDLYLCHRFSERCANRATEMDFDSLEGMVCGQLWGGRSWTCSAPCWP